MTDVVWLSSFTEGDYRENNQDHSTIQTFYWLGQVKIVRVFGRSIFRPAR